MKKTSLLVTSLFIPLLTFALSSSTTTVVTTAPVTKTCTLPTTILFQKGMKDTSKKYITTLQTILYANGYQTIQPNGVFGKETKGAVEKLQKEKGLKVTGVTGKFTVEELNKLGCQNNSSLLTSPILSPKPIEITVFSSTTAFRSQEVAKKEFSFSLYTDKKEGFSIQIPENFKELPIDPTYKRGFIFSQRTKKESHLYPTIITIAKGETSDTESSIITAPFSDLHMDIENFKKEADYTITKNGKNLRVVEGADINKVSGKEYRRFVVFYVRKEILYIVSGFTLKASWKDNKDEIVSSLLSFQFK